MIKSIKRNLALRRGVDPPENSKPEIIQVTSPRIPFVPNFILQQGVHRFVGYSKRIRNQRGVDNIFNKGEMILYLHLEATHGYVIKELIKAVMDKGLHARLKSAGFAGFIGDTSNTTVKARYLKAGFVDVKQSVPALVRLREKARYFGNVIKRGYSKKYLNSKIERIALRF